MSKVTIEEIKKLMETERDMIVVMDVNNKALKRGCETMEKHMQVMEKHMKTMEKKVEATENNTEMMKEQMKLMEETLEAKQKNNEILQKHIRLLEEQLSGRRIRSERMRLPSDCSDIMQISPVRTPTPPPPPPSEPASNSIKCESSSTKTSRWDTPASTVNNKTSTWSNRTNNIIPPFINPPMLIQPNFAPNPFNQQNGQRVVSLFNNGNSNAYENMNPCLFCAGDNRQHTSEHCTVLQDHVQRTNFMKFNHLCLLCAEPRYRCPDPQKCVLSTRECDYCRDAHANALCPLKYPQVVSNFKY